MKKLLGRCVLMALAIASSAALGTLYPLFGPSTGLLKGSAGSPQTSAAAGSDVVAVFSGTCSTAQFLRGDGSCSNALSTSSNATLTAGTSTANATLTATNGGSNSQLQLISQNGHCFNPDNVHGCLWTINSNGHLVLSSTGTLDTIWAIDLSASSQSEDINLGSAGQIGINGATTTHGYLGIGSTGMSYFPSNRGGTATVTLTGMTTAVTATMSYSTTYNEHQGNTSFANVACISIPATTGTSNATTFTVTGFPTVIRPQNGPVGGVTNVENNGVNVLGAWYYDSGTDHLVLANGVAGNESAFTNTGTKGFPTNHGFTACWELGNS